MYVQYAEMIDLRNMVLPREALGSFQIDIASLPIKLAVSATEHCFCSAEL